MSLAAALALAEKGFRVFRLAGKDGKESWETFYEIATNDEKIIRYWWDELSTDWNVGISTDDLLVVDYDVKNGLPGVAELAAHVAQGLPTDAVAQTRSGGYHVFLRLPEGVRLAPTQHKNKATAIGESIDTKSMHGYVAGAGSEGYRWINEPASVADIPLAPDWLIAQIPRYQAKTDKPQLLPDDKLDTDSAKETVRRWLLDHAPKAVAFESGGLNTIGVANICMDYVSAAATLDLLLDHWNETKADPPWELDDLERLVRHAARYRKTPIGRYSAEVEFEKVTLAEEWPCPTPFVLPEEVDIPPRDWIVKGVLCRKYLTGLVAPSGSGKTQWLAQLFLAMATGRGNIANTDVVKQSRVWSWNQEDDHEDLTRRIRASASAYNVSRDDLADRVFLDSGVERALNLVARDENGNLYRTRFVERIIKRLIERQIDVWVVDPLVEFHEGDEDNKGLHFIGATLRYIAKRADCAIIVGHHTKKPDGASSDGFAGNADASRGGTALQGVTRIMLTLFSMSEKDAKGWGVPSEERNRYVRLDGAKSNISESGRGARPDWFRWVSRAMANGESVGIMEQARLAKVASRVQRMNAIGEAVVERLTSKPAGEYRWASIRDEIVQLKTYSNDQLKKWMAAQKPEERFDGGNLKLTRSLGADGVRVEWVRDDIRE